MKSIIIALSIIIISNDMALNIYTSNKSIIIIITTTITAGKMVANNSSSLVPRLPPAPLARAIIA